MPWNDGLEDGSLVYNIAVSEKRYIRLLAGPGTGKSYAMKRRIARLLESGVSPHFILPVTLTRVAAENLHRELTSMEVRNCKDLKCTTLHSLALRILKKRNVLSIIDRTPRLLNEFEIEPLWADLKKAGHRIRESKKLCNAYAAAWARLQSDEPKFPSTDKERKFVYDITSWLKFHKSMLIGEIVPELYKYLRSNPTAPEREMYRHVLVDEYQDLNKADQSVINLLSDNADVCIVGDDNQSIYSFRYAHPDGIRKWKENCDDLETLTLSECYRCPAKVVRMANALISCNRNHNSEHLKSRAENGEGDVCIIQYDSLKEEAAGVVSKVYEYINAGVEYKDILILAQRGEIGKLIYEHLKEKQVPVKSYYIEDDINSGESQRKFSILKLFVRRDDRVALRWLLGFNSNDWRSSSYKHIRDFCNNNNMSPWKVLSDIEKGNYSIPYTKPLMTPFRRIREEIDRLDNCKNLSEVVDSLFPDEAETKNIRSIALKVMEKIDANNKDEFLSELESIIAQPEVDTKIEDIRIMSIHKSKGLSAPITIIAGCVEGLLPKVNGDISEAEKEEHIKEQRRLFYVGISRVSATSDSRLAGKLILTCSRHMPYRTAKKAGIDCTERRSSVELHTSRFIQELGQCAPEVIRG